MSLVSVLMSPLVNRVLPLIEHEVAFLFCSKAELRKLKRKVEDVEDAVREYEKGADLGDEVHRRVLDELKNIMYDTEDITEDHLRRLQPNFYVRGLYDKFKVSLLIGRSAHDIRKRLDEILDSRNQHRALRQSPPMMSSNGDQLPVNHSSSVLGYSIGTSATVVTADIVGLDMDINSIVSWVTEPEQNNGDASHTPIFAITGMAGVGKTTLARMVYNDNRIDFDRKIWVHISTTYSPLDLLKLVLRKAGGTCGEANERSEIDELIQKQVENKKLFLVLDNVWDTRVWSELLRGPLHGASRESKILMTTQGREIAMAMGAVKTHVMKPLSDETAYLMLKRIMLPSAPKDEDLEVPLKQIGQNIVKQCSGLPLAIKTVGGILLSKQRNTREWNNVLNDQTQLLKEDRFRGNFDGSLYLSYEYLPQPLKPCFLYCSLFPKGFTIFQWDLLRMWIAAGFITGKNIFEMEKKAEEYYQELMNRFLLQPQEEYPSKKMCKIHDLMHSLAVSLCGSGQLGLDYERHINSNTDPAAVRYLSLVHKTDGISEQEEIFLDIVKKKGRLRTLILFGSKVSKNLLESICSKLKYLRILDLYQTGITRLPDSVGNLVRLKLLTLSDNPINQLPDSISQLLNLQTLNIENCSNMKKLSESVMKLKNLSYLSVKDTPLLYMPQGVKNLTNLATLDGFSVGTYHEENETGCRMKELQSLSNLRFLRIYNLQRLSSPREAKDADLQGKKNLRSLRLWCNVSSSFPYDIIHMEKVFQELCPPPSLEELAIKGFNGKGFPDWVTGNFLSNLSWLRLLDCPSCIKFPALGDLPQLRVLSLNSMSAIEKINPELFRGKGKFSNLEVLSFKRMLSWEEWGDWEGGDSTFTRLKRLVLKDCPKLIALPQGLQFCKSLTELQIKRAVRLKCIEGLPSVHEMKLEGLLGLECISNLPSLALLKMSKCSVPKEVVGTESLRDLYHDHVETEEKPAWLSKMESTPGICVVPRKIVNNDRGNVKVRARYHSRAVSRAISLDSDDSDFDDY